MPSFSPSHLQRVETVVLLRAPDPSVGEGVLGVVWHELLGEDVVQIPFKALAAHLSLELVPLGDVANLGGEEVGAVHVEQALVLVQPDLREISRINYEKIWSVLRT